MGERRLNPFSALGGSLLAPMPGDPLGLWRFGYPSAPMTQLSMALQQYRAQSLQHAYASWLAHKNEAREAHLARIGVTEIPPECP